MKQKLENWVRAGDFQRVRQELKVIRWSQVPREDLADFANIAGRVGLPLLALQILNPVIRGEQFESPTAREKLIYATSLRRAGALEEALHLLREPGVSDLLEAQLQIGYCHVVRWDYASAAVALRGFVERNPDPSAYPVLVARVNLLAALIHEEEWGLARELSLSLSETLKPDQHGLLWGNLLELRAQMEVHQENWIEAGRLLTEATSHLRRAPNSTSSLYISKWQALVDIQRGAQEISALDSVRTAAVELSEWETIRDCDFYRAKISGDLQSLLQLYYGTSSPAYRRRIRQSLGRDVLFPDQLSSNPRASEIVDVVCGVSESGTLQLEPGQAPHRLFLILAEDDYRESSVINLFAQLYPDEHFHPDSSSDRAHQVLRRLRKSLSQSELDLRVSESKGLYRLSRGARTALLRTRELAPRTQEQILLKILNRKGVNGEFTSNQAASVWQVSLSTAQRILVRGEKLGLLLRHGQTSKAYWSFNFWAEKRREG